MKNRIIKCKGCGKEFYNYNKKILRIFCSRECVHAFYRGKNHPKWKGGIKNYDSKFNDKFKEKVRERYNHTCQICLKKQFGSGMEDKLSCHHIDYDKSNSEINNLIPLCSNCHAKTNGKRKKWKMYFKWYLKEKEKEQSLFNKYFKNTQKFNRENL